MIARVARPRSGLTLTEILIAILIMGVGLISLATLFPLGLIRLREASRFSRGGLAFETAADDMDARALLFKPSFLNTWYWQPVTTGTTTVKVPRDPFVQDVDFSDPTTAGSTTGIIAATPFSTNSVGMQSGLPFCYDPLWRAITGIVPYNGLSDPTLDFAGTYAVAANEARFGAGVFGKTSAHPYLRDDPDPKGNSGKIPSAYGLQRLTNFIPWSPSGLTPRFAYTHNNRGLAAGVPQPLDLAGDIFTSIDDIVFNPISGGGQPSPLSSSKAPPSSILPEMYGQTTTYAGYPQADYRFTWFFTGRQADAGGNGTQFTGEIVVCDNRPFGFEALPGSGPSAPAGETVVEAIFGYGTSNKSVLLRWPNTMPDPQVKAGGWICDVTYERNVTTYANRVGTTGTLARCYWYQVARRVDPLDPDTTNFPNYRQMVVTISSPVRSQTTLGAGGLPAHINVALVMPSVINVFPRAFEVH